MELYHRGGAFFTWAVNFLSGLDGQISSFGSFSRGSSWSFVSFMVLRIFFFLIHV